MSQTDPRPTWLDGFYSKWMPTVAARREEGRVRAEFARQQNQALSTYRGGISTRLGNSFPSPNVSYDRGTFADRLSLANMRDRGRRVFHENPIGRSILQTEVTNVAADGLTLQAKTDSREFNAEAEDGWVEFLETADVTGLRGACDFQRQSYLSSRRDGDGGIVLVDRGGQSKLQYITADLIKTPDDQWGNPLIADGVEVDQSSAPVAFHTLDIDQFGKRQFSRIPAQNFIYFTPELDDDLMVRGTTCYNTVFEKLDQIDGYVDGVATAARMATIFGLIFRGPTASNQFQTLATIANSQGAQQRAVTLENGSIRYVGEKDEMVQVNPQQPMQQTPDFIRALLRLIGLPFDMPLELIAHDMSTVNFASARIGLIGYYRACRARQKPFIAKWSRIYRWWISRERKRQAAGFADAFTTPFPEKYWPHEMRPREWDYTDPVSERQADQMDIDSGMKSEQQIHAERGGIDWEQTQIDRAAAMTFKKLKELPIDIRSTLTRDSITVRTDNPDAQENENAQPGPPTPSSGAPAKAAPSKPPAKKKAGQ